jgi:polyferredoxin
MTTTRFVTVAAVAAAAFAVAWVALRVALDYGWSLPAPPWPVVGVIALLAIGTLATAWPIRQWNAGHRDRRIDPLRAARTVALAKAAALTGAVVTGLWAAFAVTALPRLDIEAQSERAASAGFAVLASIGLLVAGLVAERWCRIPPEDDDRSRVADGSAA